MSAYTAILTGSKNWEMLSSTFLGPGWVAHLVRAWSQCTKVSGSIPGQDTYKNQPMNASVSGTTNQSPLSLSLSHSS